MASLVMVESTEKGFVVMVEDGSGPSVGMKRPRQPASIEQEFNKSKSSKKAIFETFEKAVDFAKEIVASKLCYGVWQYFPDPEYISMR